MRVNNYQAGNAAQSSDTSATKRTEEAENKEEVKKAKARHAAQIDANTDISPKAKEFAKARQIATDAPDVREAKIAELKRRIANKEYNVKPEDVADRIVEDHLQTRDLG